jgi:predicted amidohydrolase YtcJ
MLADVVILDRDPSQMPAGEIVNTQPRTTIVGGRVVYHGNVKTG